ncbi:MAG: PleD family two-component system response regulator [Pseudomonadota bacterium]
MSARILVVDDIQANRRLMQATLQAKYFQVTVAASGQEALDLAVKTQPHIILLDVMMPGMDGFEVCQRLKADERTRHIPVVMLTALTDAKERIKGLQAGADDFLLKPVDSFALISRLETLLRYTAVASELRKRQGPYAPMALTPDEEAELKRTGNILIIDRRSDSAARLASSLRAAGHYAVSWQDFKSGGAPQLRNTDLIILALSDQGHDSLKLLAHLRALETQKEVSILATYAEDDHGRAHRALKIGAGDVICQPIIAEELIARVNTQLRKTIYIDILRQRVDRGMQLSIIDPLTGLYNRRQMISELQRWMRRASGTNAQALSVIALDVDYFKRINDAYGHQAGDAVLVQIAERLRLNVRPKDIVCRQGGEEFLIIMPETDGAKAALGAERIRQAISAVPFTVTSANDPVSVTVSAGVGVSITGEETVADVLERADQALYRAKREGRNRVIGEAA